MIVAIERTCIDYGKFEQITRRGIIYVTKMKKGFNYKILKDMMVQTLEGPVEVRVQKLVLTQKGEEYEKTEHRARIVTYPDVERKILLW